MAVNKVVIKSGSEIVSVPIDLTYDTAVSSKVADARRFHGSDGEIYEGEIGTYSGSYNVNLTNTGNVTIPISGCIVENNIQINQNLQTIDDIAYSNGTRTYVPSAGYNGIGRLNVNVNVPQARVNTNPITLEVFRDYNLHPGHDDWNDIVGSSYDALSNLTLIASGGPAPVTQEKDAYPSFEDQEIIPDSGKLLSKVTVHKITTTKVAPNNKNGITFTIST